MATIGFLAMVILGGYMVLAGIATYVVQLGFSGKRSLAGVIFVMGGICVLYLAFHNAPFEIVQKGGVAIANVKGE